MRGPRLEILAPQLLDELGHGWAQRDAASVTLARILARAAMTAAVYPGFESAVLTRFGHGGLGNAALPLAGITAALDFDLAQVPGDLMRADPVHLRADPNRIILFDAETVGLGAAEADALLAELNAAFGSERITLSRGVAPTRWYARLPQALDAGLPSPRALNGTAIEACLDALKRAGDLNRIMTEAQMVLHASAVNTTREAAGHAPLNSIWFWGTGNLPRATGPTPEVVFGDDDLCAACARHSGVRHQRNIGALAGLLAASQGACILVVVPPASAALPAFVDQVLTPAWKALASGRLTRIDVYTRVADFALTRAASRRFWRRTAPFLVRAMASLEAARTD